MSITWKPGDESHSSDVDGPFGRGRCPSCDRVLDFKDENNPPDISEQSSHL